MMNKAGLCLLRFLAVLGMTLSLASVTARAQYIGHASLTASQPLTPSTSYYVWATCTDDDGGYVNPCNLQYSTSYNPDSGGHFHNTSRQSSSVSPSSGNAANGQNVQITTKAWAQEECFEAAPAGGGETGIVDYIVGNGLPDVSLFWNGEHSPGYSEDPIWYLNGAPPTRSSTGHGDVHANRYMQSNPAIGLYNATLDYLDDHSPQEMICTNDQSLPWGGLI